MTSPYYGNKPRITYPRPIGIIGRIVKIFSMKLKMPYIGKP